MLRRSQKTIQIIDLLGKNHSSSDLPRITIKQKCRIIAIGWGNRRSSIIPKPGEIQEKFQIQFSKGFHNNQNNNSNHDNRGYLIHYTKEFLTTIPLIISKFTDPLYCHAVKRR